MRLSIKHIFLFAFIIISISYTSYFFLNKPQSNLLSKEEEIGTLYTEILSLEISNLKKTFEILEVYNFNVALNKLHSAKINEKKIQEIFSDSISSETFYIKFKEYNDCINLLYNKSTHETITLKKKILELEKNIHRKNINNIDINLAQKEIEKISSLILNKKNNIKNICSKFDSLYFEINNHIK